MKSSEHLSRTLHFSGLVFLLTCCLPSAALAQQNGIDFDQHVAPILVSHCLECHSGDEPEGGLSLGDKTLAERGGENGTAVVPQNAAGSLLWQRVAANEMPPEDPLNNAEKAILKRWINEGAKWGAKPLDLFAVSTATRAGRDWWSLQPLQEVTPPRLNGKSWGRNEIDAFVLRRLNDANLQPSPEADARTLVRRLYFDLTGLPPEPAKVDAFASDPSDEAYSKLVDELLASPHYGERWARHWLDIVRFGESNGFEYDQPRDNAWHYRNWVINALNQDMPYDEFVRLQLSGDILHPDDANAIAAAGFLVAGPHNTTLPANDAMRMTMAQDELEDLVGIVGQTFLGLTTNCARCHDHKFDPISQKEYYQLAATLSGVTHGERELTVPLTLQQQRRLATIDEQLNSLQRTIDSLEQPVRKQILAEREDGIDSSPDPPKAFAAWEFDDDLKDRIGSLDLTVHGDAVIKDGALVLNGTDAFASSAPLPVDLNEKTIEVWVQLDNLTQRGGGAISVQTLDGITFDAIVFGEREPGKWMAGSNGFVRTQSFQGEDEADATHRFVHVAIVYHADGTIIGYRDGKPYGKPYRPRELQRYAAEKAHVIFGLRHSPVGGNRMLAGRIQRAQLYNRALSSAEVVTSAGVADRNYVSKTQLLARFSDAQRSEHQRLTEQHTTLQQESDAIKNAQTRKIYTCVSKQPGITRVLRRGDVGSPAEEVSPAGLNAVNGPSPDFGLTPNAADAERRIQLADWVTHSNNPLFARVIVNRLWQYHFGRGIITTPSDFGFNGGQPSHPALLEWLANSLRSNGYHLKALHRLIVTSSAYRQSSRLNANALKTDAGNRWLWRKSPHRLEAEEIRDAILAATGQLNREIGGPGYRDVRHFQFKGSNFYESINESGPEAMRRTIYRFNPRGGSNPFLNTFDCPDPSATLPNRPSTTTPLQALSLMNNALVFTMSERFAERVKREAGDDASAQINLIYNIAYSRRAADDEVRRGQTFIQQYGLESFCRVILNSNEFLYVR